MNEDNKYIEELHFESSNGRNIIYAKIFSPVNIGLAKGIIQISHGMCEDISKYEPFINFLVSNNYIVGMHEHIGHGKSINDRVELGFFADKNGYKFLVEDVYSFSKILKNKFLGMSLFLFSHSMGSLIARVYASKYGNKINGLVVCGTVGPNKLVDGGIQLAESIIQRKGKLYRSRKLDQLSFNYANARFMPAKTKFDWVSSDEDYVARKDVSERNFIFTASGFKDLFCLVKYANEIETIENTPKDLPIFFIAGDMDPVGENGAGVKRVYNTFLKTKFKEVSLKLYEGKRHDLLNETNKDEVQKDILDWIDTIRFGEE